jgi:hypothetical protein
VQAAGNWRVRDGLGRALFWYVTNSDLWHHRKIESHRLLDGPRSRRHVSIDLTVPDDGRLLVESVINDELRAILVPLALVTKGALQDFDASVAGSVMLVADSTVNGLASIELLRTAWTFDVGRAPTDDEEDFLSAVVFSARDGGEPSLVDAFLAGQGVSDTDAIARLSDFTKVLLGSLERCFLLLGLLPEDTAGTHTLVKYSEHWELASADRAGGFTRLNWLLASTGWTTAALEIELNDAGLRPRSYHVEVHAPTGLLSERLVVERAREDGADGGPPLGVDTRHTAVSHVAASGVDRPPTAYIDLAVSTSGLLARAAVAFAASAVLFICASFGSIAASVFDPAARSAASLFLAVIAVLLGSLTRDAENPVSARYLLPLRVTLIVLAALYFIAAALVAVGTGVDSGTVVIRIEALLVSAGAVLVVGGHREARRRQVQRAPAELEDS